MRKAFQILAFTLCLINKFAQDLPIRNDDFQHPATCEWNNCKLNNADTFLGKGQITMVSGSNDLYVLMSQLNAMAPI